MRRGKFCARERSATIVVFVTMMLTTLLVALALGADIAYLVGAKRQLHTSVDSCAWATAYYVANRGLASDPDTRAANSTAAEAFGRQFLQHNPVEHITLAFSEQDPSPVQIGLAVWENDHVVGFTPNAVDFDAVRVQVTMDGAHALPAIIGNVVGREAYHPQAEAIVLLDVQAPGHVLPFSILETAWDDAIDGVGDDDEWSWHETDGVMELPDGEPELVLYPKKDWQIPGCTGECCGSGNFGALQFEECGQGNPCWQYWIENGVPPEVYDTATGGALDATDGDPGLSLGNPIVDALNNLMGSVVGVFRHAYCDDDNGSNTTYRILDIQYARLMLLEKVNGNSVPGNWRLIIQPVDEEAAGGGSIEVVGLGM